MLRQSECTSCQFNDDKSAYWTPSLHFAHENGKTEIVPQVGGMLAYYLLLGDNIKAFPKGFQVLAGDSRLRNFSGPVPDPPTSSWTDADKTQVSLGQKAIGMNCMNYNKAPEGSRYRHFLPTKEYMDEHCADGIRAEIMFQSCWNGKDVTSSDHKSHVAYPSLVDGGECPEGFETRLPTLFYETIWDTYAFKDKAGQFVWSNGDPTGRLQFVQFTQAHRLIRTGYGYHADFINGWNIDTLQSAVDTCTNLSGRVEDCPVFSGKLQTEAEQGTCKIQDTPSALKNDNCSGPADGLCGDVPVQYGPQYANPLKPGAGGGEPSAKPTLSSAAPVPTQGYAPAHSEGAAGVSVYNVKSSAPAAAPAAPAITPAAVAQNSAPNDGGVISTSTYTKDGVVYEVCIKEVEVTVTVTEGAEATPSHYRRHAHMHRRGEHGLARH